MARKITHKRYDIATALVVAVLFGLNVKAAKAETVTVRVISDVPTVAGIRQAPVPHRAYQSKPTVNVRPTARVMHLGDVAPPNGCRFPAFEVVSGPVSERGCYGTR